MTVKKTFNKIPLLLKVPMFLLVTIGIFMVIRSLFLISQFMISNKFSKQTIITILHIVPGAIFMILGPLQFTPSIRLRHLQFHRRSGRVFILAAYITGITSIVDSFSQQLMGGVNEAVASVFFSIFFLVCISMSLYAILRKKVRLHREWMIRAFSIGLAIATIRIITVMAFIFFKVPRETFLGTAFWMGFTLHAIVAEIWINHTRHVITRSDTPVMFEDIKENLVHQ